jgi:predicted amidohydrolase YtcJ
MTTVGWIAVGCTPEDDGAGRSVQPAEKIYVGDIVTVNDAQPDAEAVAVREGLILAVGGAEDVMAYRGNGTEVIELGSHTMLPGFVDAHGHLKNVGFQALSADLLPPPDSDVDTIERLQEKLRAWGEGEASQTLGWIIGFVTTTPNSPRAVTRRETTSTRYRGTSRCSSSINPDTCTAVTRSFWRWRGSRPRARIRPAA